MGGTRAGWSWGYVSAIDSRGRTIWIADAHRDDGKRFVARADDLLTAFVELEWAISAQGRRQINDQSLGGFTLHRLLDALISLAWASFL